MVLILYSSLPLIEAKIAELNKRLAKAGIVERFNLSISEPYWKVEESFAHKMVEVELSKPVISIGGWSFVGSLERLEKGYLYHGFTREAHVIEHYTCEHCNTNRNRKRLFLVEKEGEELLLGSTCLQPFLGVSAPPLWIFDILEEEHLEDFERAHNRSGGPGAVPLKKALSLAIISSDYGKSFVASNSLGENMEPSTVSRVKNYLFGQGVNGPLVDEIDGAALSEALKIIFESVVGLNGDWGENLKDLLQEDWVEPRHLGLLCSAVVLLRERAPKVEFKPGHVGKVGAKLEKQSLEVVRVSTRTAPGYSYYAPEIEKDTVVFKTENGNQIVFFASRTLGLEEGTKVEVVSARIKAHGSYKGTDQTVIQRARFREMPAE